jgi:poly-gamma-glutamate synthesis protein (capsule biosynthesis protein)
MMVGRSVASRCSVAVNWGKEYSSDPYQAPGIANDDPRVIGRALIDAGADVIVGNHPHWVQGVELYHQGFIAYAHGNFIFDQEWSRETKEGVIGAYTFHNKKLSGVSFIPVIIENYGQPRLASETESAVILERMRSSSERLR